MTVIFCAAEATCALVTIYPLLSTITPEPKDCSSMNWIAGSSKVIPLVSAPLLWLDALSEVMLTIAGLTAAKADAKSSSEQVSCKFELDTDDV